MAEDGYEVVVSAGTLRPGDPAVVMPHRWTEGGVAVEAPFTGAHLYHLAAAGCVLNDVYREAERLGITLNAHVLGAVSARTRKHRQKGCPAGSA